MARILVAVTGSVAAVKVDALVATLAEERHDIRLMLTKSAEFFVPHWAEAGPQSRFPVYRDRNEWPASGWSRGDDVLHIELGRWADAFLIAPLDAHTLAKWAQGMADNLVTSVLRAWDYAKPLVVAPAMNTRMWDNPITCRHFAQILCDREGIWPPHGKLPKTDEIVAAFERWYEPLEIVMPIEKRLACGDVGIGAMAEVETISLRLNAVLRSLRIE